jgi:hypothetical protein
MHRQKKPGLERARLSPIKLSFQKKSMRFERSEDPNQYARLQCQENAKKVMNRAPERLFLSPPSALNLTRSTLLSDG